MGVSWISIGRRWIRKGGRVGWRRGGGGEEEGREIEIGEEIQQPSTSPPSLPPSLSPSLPPSLSPSLPPSLSPSLPPSLSPSLPPSLPPPLPSPLSPPLHTPSTLAHREQGGHITLQERTNHPTHDLNRQMLDQTHNQAHLLLVEAALFWWTQQPSTSSPT
ncbi:unnamed protein product [Closterium sp. Naga37s-1]|nr:unnamed protein product [Closterium sp. Naga37s-1]